MRLSATTPEGAIWSRRPGLRIRDRLRTRLLVAMEHRTRHWGSPPFRGHGLTRQLRSGALQPLHVPEILPPAQWHYGCRKCMRSGCRVSLVAFRSAPPVPVPGLPGPGEGLIASSTSCIFYRCRTGTDRCGPPWISGGIGGRSPSSPSRGRASTRGRCKRRTGGPSFVGRRKHRATVPPCGGICALRSGGVGSVRRHRVVEHCSGPPRPILDRNGAMLRSRGRVRHVPSARKRHQYQTRLPEPPSRRTREP